MTNHSEDHERMVAEYLAGERSAADPALEALRTTCDRCNEAMAELPNVEQDLTDAHARAFDSIERELRAEGAPSEADLDAVRAAMPDRFGAGSMATPPRARPSRGRWVRAAALAAAVLLAVLVIRSALPGEDRETFLGPDTVTELLAPAPDATEPRFRWSGDLSQGCVYQVRVFGVEAGARALVAESRDLVENQWTPDTTNWPRDVTWEVRVVDPSGQVLSSSGSSWRRD